MSDSVTFKSVPVKTLNEYASAQMMETNSADLRDRHYGVMKQVTEMMNNLRKRGMNEWTPYDKLIEDNMWRSQGCHRFTVAGKHNHLFGISIQQANDVIRSFIPSAVPRVNYSSPLMEQRDTHTLTHNVSADLRFRTFRALEHRGASQFATCIHKHSQDWNYQDIPYHDTLKKYPFLEMLPDVMKVYINNILGGRWSPVNCLFKNRERMIAEGLRDVDDRNVTSDRDLEGIFNAVMLYMTSDFIFQLYAEVICNCPSTEPPGYRIFVLNHLLKVTSGIPVPAGNFNDMRHWLSNWLHDIFDPCMNINRGVNHTLLPFCKNMETLVSLGSFGDERRVEEGKDQNALIKAWDVTSQSDNMLNYIWRVALQNQMDRHIPDTVKLSPRNGMGESRPLYSKEAA